ncbi:MAG: hypothetical protein M0R51_16390 [Clostridia bacterium]|nr:hypothetical protein [Clostridia bacterium]
MNKNTIQEWHDNLFKPSREGGYCYVGMQNLWEESEPIVEPLKKNAQNVKSRL